MTRAAAVRKPALGDWAVAGAYPNVAHFFELPPIGGYVRSSCGKRIVRPNTLHEPTPSHLRCLHCERTHARRNGR